LASILTCYFQNVARQSRNGFSNVGSCKRLSSSLKCPDPLCGPSGPSSVGTGSCFPPVVKRQGHQVDHIHLVPRLRMTMSLHVRVFAVGCPPALGYEYRFMINYSYMEKYYLVRKKDTYCDAANVVLESAQTIFIHSLGCTK
jgi:hypothetical protein